MKHKAYVLKTVLPQGALFPFDFGSVLGSVTDDGNPVDALILTDEPLSVVVSLNRALFGVIEANKARMVSRSATIG